MTPDIIVWNINSQTGMVKVDLAYLEFLKHGDTPVCRWWHKALWKLHIPGKFKYFCWLALNQKLLTWDALRTRGYSGPGVFFLCLAAIESVDNLFGCCSFFHNTVQSLFQMLRSD